jgi:hypothetical protein
MEISVCGLVCSECQFYNVSCKGCKAVEGSTFWAKEMLPSKVCALYECAVTNKKYGSCGECSELPCKMFRELKDPNSSEEEHLKSIDERVLRLRQN